MIFIILFITSIVFAILSLVFLIKLPNDNKTAEQNLNMYFCGYYAPVIVDIIILLILNIFVSEVKTTSKYDLIIVAILSVYMIIVLFTEYFIISKKRKQSISKEDYERIDNEKKFYRVFSRGFSLLPWLVNLLFKTILFIVLLNL